MCGIDFDAVRCVSGLLVYVAHCGFVLVLCVARAMWCGARGRRGVVQCAWHVWCGGALINVAIPATIPFIPPSSPTCPALVLLLSPLPDLLLKSSLFKM